MDRLKGSVVALITPFKDDGSIDWDAFASLLEWHVSSKTDAILVAGTTGESATLSHDEHKELIKFAVEYVKGRKPIIAGTGSNSTREAIDLTEYAASVGADASLLVCPYYNKPTQAGLYQHYRAIAEAVKPHPVILYNVPSRTSRNIEPSTVRKLAEIENIVGIKEASGDMKQVSKIIGSIKRELGRRDFLVLSGDDFTTIDLMVLGGDGVISVVANVLPDDTHDMVDAALKGDYGKARDLHFSLEPVAYAMFLETNPVPVKTALYLMGKIPVLRLRLPLVSLSAENEAKLKSVLKTRGLIS